METIEKDAVASVHYTGTYPESGEVFDTSREGEPLAFLARDIDDFFREKEGKRKESVSGFAPTLG